MPRLVLLIMLGTSFLAGACEVANSPYKTNEIVPQARPVFTWLKAVKSGDQELLKAVFSRRMRTRLEKRGWGKVLKQYEKVFRESFGDYALGDFSFEFTGGEKKGQVAVVQNGKKFPGLQVIKEDADWKVNER